MNKIETLLRQIKCNVMETTGGLNTTDYIWLMRELSSWAQQEVYITEDGDTLLDNN